MVTTTKIDAGHFLVCCLVALFTIGFYDLGVHWPFPLMVFSASNLLVDYPVILVVVLLCYFPAVKPGWLAVGIPVAMVLTAYVAFDAFYYFLKRAPQPSDFQNLSLILDFAPMLLWTGIAALAVLVVLAAYLLHRVIQTYPRVRRLKSLGVRLLLLVTLGLFLMGPAYQQLVQKTFVYLHWSDRLNARQNGRLAAFLYYGARERVLREKIDTHRASSSTPLDALFPGTPVNRPNIHVIVLESFLDPRQVLNARFDRSPLADELRPFMLNGTSFSSVTSPIYGGNSAQAEFELLTGVRALAQVSTVEFNVMRGGGTDGLIRRLKQQGYYAVATKASNSAYFNSALAYRSLGFDRTVYLGDRKEKPADGEPILFDGDLYADNLAMLRRHRSERGRPIFNYVVGMYGHMPYAMKSPKRPEVIGSDYPDERIRRIANQFYYRTQALGEYLVKLRELDPDSLVFICSDHLPPVFGDHNHYDGDPMVNIALFRVGDRAVDVSGSSFYEIPWRIWDVVTGKENTREIGDGFWMRAYLHLLAQSRPPQS